MKEYFIVANSFAAPFVSDQSTGYVAANSPAEALEKFAASYSHPAGLYSAIVYDSADAMHKGEEKLATWLCNHEQEMQKATKSLGLYLYTSLGPGRFEIDGVIHEIDDPKGGSVVSC